MLVFVLMMGAVACLYLRVKAQKPLSFLRGMLDGALAIGVACIPVAMGMSPLVPLLVAVLVVLAVHEAAPLVKYERQLPWPEPWLPVAFCMLTLLKRASALSLLMGVAYECGILRSVGLAMQDGTPEEQEREPMAVYSNNSDSGVGAFVSSAYKHTLEECRRKARMLLAGAFATTACIPLLMWFARTFPVASVFGLDPTSERIQLVSVVAPMLLAALLFLLHALLSDSETVLEAVGEAAVLTLGLHLMPHCLNYGLGAAVALLLILALCYLGNLAYGGSSQGPCELFVGPVWWLVQTSCLCCYLSLCLTYAGLLPYASGVPRLIPDNERKLSQNMEDVQAVFDTGGLDVGCAERARLFQTVVMVESRYLGIPPEEEPVVEIAPIENPAAAAHYDKGRNVIVISPYAMRRADGSEGMRVLYVICHEVAHAWQFRAIEDPSILNDTRMPIEVDEVRIATWEYEFSNYVDGDGGTVAEYESQDCEIFADEYAADAVISYMARLNSPEGA